ncbi:type II toxin-antitoxin system Phd/YefM family antitoxin [Candidatus Hakubella thermalkaliphila]|uniref:type II toxin-antitoxin system Phd/YefM family antitoxin n=1 Tax=Candidatus Hakubella thermalkaliphila TaxID=2754717 RepID=UPI00159360FF|nr:type II toxin-antitoxin system Phd/YefM family antitoxin [Candidatus Hakubella thermalkaliphila]
MPELNRKPMLKNINATEARIHFGDVLKRAIKGEEHFIVERRPSDGRYHQYG